MRNFYLTSLLALCSFMSVWAQKELYIPREWKNPWPSDSLLYSEIDSDNRYTWSKSRSKESDNFIVYWDKNYGNTVPTNAANTYKVDIDDLLEKAEYFYSLNVGELAFCDESNSNVSKYKMMILVNYSTDWICYGGGYDDVIGALWLSPSTCKPVGFAVAHEVGHSFQYQTYSDLKGFAGFRTAIGSGSTFWEQTAQWQAAQAFPEQKWNESWNLYKTAHNYAMTHEYYRYQSYWWHYYLTEKNGIDYIGKIWRYNPDKGIDPNEVLMKMSGMSVEDFYNEFFHYAMKMATIDLNEARNEAGPYIGTLRYDYVSLGGAKHQVSYSSCPQSTGFNVIPLNVPAPNTKITTIFTSLTNGAMLANGDSKQFFNGEKFESTNVSTYNKVENYNSRGFRLGYVALMNDGSREYIYDDNIYCQGGTEFDENTCEVSCTVPNGVDRLFLVVSPAPSVYFQHKWDDNVANDDQWPYTVEFTNTNILGTANITEGQSINDIEISYDVYFTPNSSVYPAINVKLGGTELSDLGTAFQMQTSGLGNVLESWNENGPNDGHAMFYAVDPNGTINNAASTANGYGHWYNENGVMSAYSNGYLYSEFDPASMTFTIGQYPGKLSVGDSYTIRQAIKYVRGTETAIATFIFNVHIDESRTDYELSNNNGESSDIKETIKSDVEISAIYSVSGVKQNSLQKGINILRMNDGSVQKVIIK